MFRQNFNLIDMKITIRVKQTPVFDFVTGCEQFEPALANIRFGILSPGYTGASFIATTQVRARCFVGVIKFDQINNDACCYLLEATDVSL